MRVKTEKQNRKTGRKRLPYLTAGLVTSLLLLTGCQAGTDDIITTEKDLPDEESLNITERYPEAHVLSLSQDSATLDGVAIDDYDYTWHCDPTTVHDEVDNAPAEYYTGTKPENTGVCYIDHDLQYYPSLDEEDFQLVNYDGEQEWAYYYQDGENEKYIFATLPRLGQSVPTAMMHTEEEAAANQVLHITEAGEYILQGDWQGQVRVDLGDDASDDEQATVTLIFDNADIQCDVAPGVVFANVYECDNAWEDREDYSDEVDTSKAGARVILADDTENHVSGTNVFRMLKTKYKNEEDTSEVSVQKKMRKTDGAFYSYMTMNIYGEEQNTGSLVVDAGFEGIDSELHLSIYGGNITVNSQDDGMNVNEDNVSVIAFYGGSVTINAALGEEGDGVDSNGYIRVDGGTVSVNGIRVPDSALDSEDGVYCYKGTILVDGEEQEYEAGQMVRETGGGAGGNMGPGGQPGERPDVFNGKRPEDFDAERPEGFDGKRPEGFDGQPPELPTNEKPEQ